VARIERAWLDAYHAADAEPLAHEALAGVPPGQLADIGFVAHPATRLLRSRHPAVSLFAAARSGGSTEGIETAGPEDALVTRPGPEVVVRRLPAGGAAFLESLMAGEPLGAAAAAALDESPDFDLAANVAGMLAAGAFAAIDPRGRP
jgi:hypothetical protein